MKKLRNAFTMLELVFVIVILGILTAVALPKLNATRNDAVTSRTAHHIMLGASEIASYAIAKGTVDADFKTMSNAIGTLENEGQAVLTSARAVVSNCVVIEVLSGGNDENLTISFISSGIDSDCVRLQSLVDARQYPMQLRGSLVQH